MKDHFNERFDEVNERFDEVNERLGVVDERLDALERHPREEVPKQAYRQFFERARSTPVPVYSATGTTAHTVNRIFKKCSDGDNLHLQDLHFLLQLKPRWVPLQEGSQPLSLMHAESEADSQHLMIRAIYPCILEKLKQAFTDKSAPGVILTGSPGVGKSWLGNLVVWQFIRLAAEPQAPLFHGTCADGSPKDRAVIYRSGCLDKTVVFHFSGKTNEPTVRQLNHVGADLPRDIVEHCTCVVVVDLYGRYSGLYVPGGRDGFEVVIASPLREEYEDFHKKKGAQELWIPELSETEVLALIRQGLVPGCETIEAHRIRARCMVLGGRPRTIIRSLTQRMRECDGAGLRDHPSMVTVLDEALEADIPWVYRVHTRLMECVGHKFRRIQTIRRHLKASVGSKKRKWSHSLLRYEVAPDFGSATYTWLSCWLIRQVWKAQRQQLAEQMRFNLSSIMKKQAKDALLYGELFEYELHQQLLEPCKLRIRRLRPQEQGSKEEWHLWTWPGVVAANPAERSRMHMLDVRDEVIKPSLLTSQDWLYVTPASRQFPVVDGFARLPHKPAFMDHTPNVLALQMTIAKRHNPPLNAWERVLPHILPNNGPRSVVTDLLFVVPHHEADDFQYQHLSPASAQATVFDDIHQWVVCLHDVEDPQDSQIAQVGRRESGGSAGSHQTWESSTSE